MPNREASEPSAVQQSAGTLDLYSMQIRAFEGESVLVTDLLALTDLAGRAHRAGQRNDVNCTDVFTTRALERMGAAWPEDEEHMPSLA